MQSLPEEARPVVEDAFRARRAEIREKVLAVGGARREVGRLMAKEGLDRARLEVGLGEVRARTGDLLALLHEILAGAMLDLPPEVRAERQPRWRLRRGRQ